MFIILFSYISTNKIRRIYYIIHNYLIIKWLKISLLPIFASYQQFQQMSYFFENCVGGGRVRLRVLVAGTLTVGGAQVY